jgi:hypothetical protein
MALSRMAILNFILYERESRGDNPNLNKQIFAGLVFAFVFCFLMGIGSYCAYSYYGGHNITTIFFTISVLLLPVYLVFAICVLCLRYKLKPQKYIALGAVQVYGAFLFFSLFVSSEWFFDSSYIFLLPFTIIVVVALIAKSFLVQHRLRKNSYRSKRNARVDALAYALAIPAVLIFPRLLSGLDMTLVFGVIFVIFAWNVQYAALGAIFFLKYYLIKKYDITLEEIEAKARQDMEEAAAKKR